MRASSPSPTRSGALVCTGHAASPPADGWSLNHVLAELRNSLTCSATGAVVPWLGAPIVYKAACLLLPSVIVSAQCTAYGRLQSLLLQRYQDPRAHTVDCLLCRSHISGVLGGSHALLLRRSAVRDPIPATSSLKQQVLLQEAMLLQVSSSMESCSIHAPKLMRRWCAKGALS